MARKTAAIVFSLGCLQAGSVMALGLGEFKLESFLNQPLNASVDLLNMGGLHEEEIKVRLATREDFDKLGLDRAYFLTNITFEVLSDGKGGAQIVMTSEQPVLEPYLDFVVEARWPSGRLLREYTVLVDPPVFSDATVVVSASERVEEVENIPAPEKKRVSEGSTTGTQVEVRRTELPSGAMPQRDYNSTTALSPEPGSQYMVNRDQTLWDIASQAKPDGASVHQTMLDIQRLNPDAFINGNINRVKAGYIIYLPTADDISSGDITQALAEVREQNAAWREGRDAELYASGGPSLSISADEPMDDASDLSNEAEAEASIAPAVDEPSDDEAGTLSSGADTDVSDSGDLQEGMAAMEHQVETLERIITLKDEQIAALQSALAEAGVTADMAEGGFDEEPPEVAELEVDPMDSSGVAPLDEGLAEEVSFADQEIESAAAEPAAAEEPAASPKPAEPKPAEPKPEASDGWMDYLWYILGAVVLGVVGLVVARRRGDDTDDGLPPESAAASKDVFSDVQLKEQRLEVEAKDSDAVAETAEPNKPGNRGYGEHKHDEYASDVDAADALAEADIYIAYGRHPQAIDLLNNALASDPSNSVYRLKLLEIHTELNDYGAATAQLEKLREIGDPDSIARAEALMDGVRGTQEPAPVVAETAAAGQSISDGPGISPNPLDIISDSDDALEKDFSGLEIEGSGAPADDADELDLSNDFVGGREDAFEEEELVIAADSNGLSTKLDLARAYLDMGDDEGARQILDEVIAEGSEELQAEARVLLDRIGG